MVSKINEICRLVFESVKDRLEQKYGCFELFGLDFMLDDKLNPQLIEVNVNPALFTDTQVQKEMLPKLVDDTIKLGLQLHPAGQKDGCEAVKNFVEEGGVKELSLGWDIIYHDKAL